MSSRRYAITGGGGFLGRKVAQALANHPEVELVVCADIRDLEPPIPGVITKYWNVTRG